MVYYCNWGWCNRHASQTRPMMSEMMHVKSHTPHTTRHTSRASLANDIAIQHIQVQAAAFQVQRVQVTGKELQQSIDARGVGGGGRGGRLACTTARYRMCKPHQRPFMHISVTCHRARSSHMSQRHKLVRILAGGKSRFEKICDFRL